MLKQLPSVAGETNPHKTTKAISPAEIRVCMGKLLSLSLLRHSGICRSARPKGQKTARATQPKNTDGQAQASAPLCPPRLAHTNRLTTAYLPACPKHTTPAGQPEKNRAGIKTNRAGQNAYKQRAAPERRTRKRLNKTLRHTGCALGRLHLGTFWQNMPSAIFKAPGQRNSVSRLPTAQTDFATCLYGKSGLLV